MKKYYFYKTKIKSNNALVCYYSGHDFNGQDLAVEVAQEFKSLLFVQNLIIVTPSFNSNEIDEYLSHGSNVDSLKDKINTYQSLNVHCIYVEENGNVKLNLFKDEKANKVRRLTESFARTILNDGLYVLCKERSLVQSSPHNYHYVKPSGKHTKKFIQVANILESATEASFVALNLLKYVPEGINKIYVDTSGIYPLAYELSNLICAFRGSKPNIEIDAYGSYGGINDYDFSSDKNTLVIISASTSNKLYKIMKVGGQLESASVVSVASSVLGNDKLNVLIKFNEYFEKYKDNIFEGFSSYKEEECELCIDEHSIPLFLNKKRFVFEEPKLERYLPLASDSEASLKSLISDYKNSNAFRCLFDGEKKQSKNPREYYIDVEKLLLSEAYIEKIEKMIHRDFPMGVDYMIYAGDSGSKELAEKIGDHIKEHGNEIKIISSNEIKDNIANFRKGVTVVTGFLQTGKTVLNISRALRDCKDIPVTYIIGFATFNEVSSYKKLQMDLRYSDGKYGFHKYCAIDQILLPINVSRTHSWTKEAEFIKKVIEKYEEDKSVYDLLEDRDKFLRESNSDENKGMSSSLFLSSPEGKKLKLGPTFAFWSSKDNSEECEDHSLVYYTISSILQKLRTTKSDNGVIPLGKGYVTRVLDPLLFDRFNEGIIHSSILRAALPRELDYSCDDDSSRVLQAMLSHMIENPTDTQSEALPEFLLAICTRKLQIKKDYLEALRECSIDKNSYPLVWCLAEEAKSILFPAGDEEKVEEASF